MSLPTSLALLSLPESTQTEKGQGKEKEKKSDIHGAEWGHQRKKPGWGLVLSLGQSKSSFSPANPARSLKAAGRFFLATAVFSGAEGLGLLNLILEIR